MSLRYLSFPLLVVTLAACDGPAPIEDDDDGGGGAAQSSSSTSSSTGGGNASETIEIVDNNGAPAAGVDIVVHDAQGSAVATTASDADGSAALEVPGDGGVTLLWNDGAEIPTRSARSLIRLPQGAHLRTAINRLPPPPSDRAMTITVSVGSLPSETQTLVVFLSCRPPMQLSGSTTFSYAGCPGSDEYGFIAVAIDMMGKARGIARWEHEPIHNGLHTTFSLSSFMFSLDHPQVALDFPDFPVADFDVFITSAGFVAHAPTGPWMGTASAQINWLVPKVVSPMFDAGALVDVNVWLWDGFEAAYGHRERRADLPSALSYAFRDLPFPALDSVDATLPRPRLGYTLDASAGLGDALTARLHWGWEPIHTWEVHAPVSATGSIAFPEIPDELADYRPDSLLELWLVHADADGAGDPLGFLEAQSASSWYVAESSTKWAAQ